jgi:hypothetical protein
VHTESQLQITSAGAPIAPSLLTAMTAKQSAKLKG